MAAADLTAARLRELFHYDPDTGVFTRLVRVNRYPTVGTLNTRGYRIIHIGSRNYRTARLAFLYMTGSWPEFEVDHIDGQKTNDKFSNLRDVTKSINAQNKHVARNDNSSGLLGAHKLEGGKAWTSSIRVCGKQVSIGKFKTAQEAHDAYVKMKRIVHGGCTI